MHTEFTHFFPYGKHNKFKLKNKFSFEIAIIYFISLHYIINNNSKAGEHNNKPFISLPPLRKRKSLSSDAQRSTRSSSHGSSSYQTPSLNPESRKWRDNWKLASSPAIRNHRKRTLFFLMTRWPRDGLTVSLYITELVGNTSGRTQTRFDGDVEGAKPCSFFSLFSVSPPKTSLGVCDINPFLI